MKIPVVGLCGSLLLSGGLVAAFTLSFSSDDFSKTPVFSNVVTFDFSAEVSAPLIAGAYSDPALNVIGYNVSGSLSAGTPSGFPAFAFQLSHLIAPPPSPPTVIPGTQFYSLYPTAFTGERLSFQIAPTVDWSDGLQLGELEDLGGGVIFRFNGREVNTGRYHATYIELRSDGTGLIQNANNRGGINPITNQEVDVDLGEEYITNLSFDPMAVTVAVPEPTTAGLGVIGLVGLMKRRRI